MSVESAEDQIKRFKEQLEIYELDDLTTHYVDKHKDNINSIAIVGMGGSALSGELLKNYLESKGFKKPIFIIRTYELPNYIQKDTLLLVQSYSGNTEETLSCLKDAFKKQIPSIVITSNGILKDYAKKYEYPYIEMPQHWQPRLAIGFFLMRELAIISKVFDLDFSDEFKRVNAINWTKLEEMAKSLSERIEKTPLIYVPYTMSAIGYIWKALINECAKMHCFTNTFSELNHNEMVGFTLDKDYYVIMIQDETDHYRIKKRIELMQSIFKKSKIKSVVINLNGGTLFTRLISLVYMGMWLGFYLALKNKVDPEKVEIIENFKKKLGRFV